MYSPPPPPPPTFLLFEPDQLALHLCHRMVSRSLFCTYYCNFHTIFIHPTTHTHIHPVSISGYLLYEICGRCRRNTLRIGPVRQDSISLQNVKRGVLNPGSQLTGTKALSIEQACTLTIQSSCS